MSILTKDLIVGDIHAVPDELDDVDCLMVLMENSSKYYKPDRMILLGDLHHTFAVTNVKVMEFYRSWFKRLKQYCPIIALVGNHDMPGTGAQYPHALLAYEDLITIADRPLLMDETLFLPYYANPNLFIEAIEKNPAKRIYCHQEFIGANYNSYVATRGVDSGKLPNTVISGHVHTPQRLPNVWYVGAPRWRTLTDANIDRYIYLLDGDEGMRIHTDRCKRIWSLKLVENSEDAIVLRPRINDKDEFRFHIEGSPEYVKREVDLLKKENIKHLRINTNIIGKKIVVKESEGIDVAFKKYSNTFKAKNGTPPDVLAEKASKLIYET